MKQVDFFALSRAVQGRVLDSFAGRFPPSPIVYARGRPGGRWIWVLVSGVAAAALVVAWRAGFGNLKSALAVQAVPSVALYAVAGFGLLLGLLQLMAQRARAAALPWVAAVYAFPTTLIDARRHVLSVYGLDELVKIERGRSSVKLVFQNASFTFPLPSSEAAAEGVIAIEAARERAKQPIDIHTLFELDPLQPPSVTSPLATQIPMKRRAPLWARQPWPFALLLGGAAGAALWQLRNSLSDEQMFATAQAMNNPTAYRAYLERGRRHREQVASVLLPRAELSEAQKHGSVEAIDAFIAKNQSSGITAEVQTARRAALVAAFERARDKGTLRALHEFSIRYPDHSLAQELNAARHAVFQRALASYKKQASKESPEGIRIVQQLLAYAERKGPRMVGGSLRGPAVQIRFQRVKSETLGRADIALAKNLSFNGTVSYPTRYFDEAQVEPSERALADVLIERFSAAFPAELVAFERGQPFEAPEGELPQLAVPTVAISRRVEWTGGAYESKRPRGIFVGLLFLYRASFVVPGDPNPPRFKHNVVEQVPQEFLTKNAALPPGELEQKVYDFMVQNAREQFAEKYLGRWFADPIAKR